MRQSAGANVAEAVARPAVAAAGVPRPAVPPPGREPVRTRRRPLLLGLGLALTALGGLGAVWLATSGTGTVSVLGVSREVRAGQVIDRQDLVSVQIATGTALRAVPVQDADSVIGKRALTRLAPGGLVNPDAVADKMVPAQGQALVGLNLAAGQKPALPLEAGDRVEIVYTPGGQDVTTTSPSRTAPVLGVVVSSDGDPDTGKTVVDVSVPTDAAVKVATWGSAGHATVVLLPVSGG